MAVGIRHPVDVGQKHRFDSLPEEVQHGAVGDLDRKAEGRIGLRPAGRINPGEDDLHAQLPEEGGVERVERMSGQGPGNADAAGGRGRSTIFRGRLFRLRASPQIRRRADADCTLAFAGRRRTADVLSVQVKDRQPFQKVERPTGANQFPRAVARIGWAVQPPCGTFDGLRRPSSRISGRVAGKGRRCRAENQRVPFSHQVDHRGSAAVLRLADILIQAAAAAEGKPSPRHFEAIDRAWLPHAWQVN